MSLIPFRHSKASRSEEPAIQGRAPDGRDRAVTSSWFPGSGFARPGMTKELSA